LSFLDEPDEPVRRPPTGRGQARRRPGGGPPADRQTLMVRRTVAAGVGVLVLILLVLAVRGCLNERKERAFKDYVQEVAGLSQDSVREGEALFDLLSGGGGRDEAVEIENRLNAVRSESAEVVDRAKETDHPDELDGAQSALVEALEFRRDGIKAVADALPTALGDQDRREGARTVTAQMQTFLASDVIYTQRFVPRLQGALEDEQLTGEVRIPASQFLPHIRWLEPAFVSDRISGIRTGRGGEAAAPGLHGNGIGTVNLGGQALAPGGTANVKVSDDLQFQVQIANQGEHTETGVPVRVTLGRGGDEIEVEEEVDSIGAGETKTVNVPLTEAPPTGRAVPITIEVEAVPGEKKTDNNRQTYSAIFTR
jgi:hypothetical protein